MTRSEARCPGPAELILALVLAVAVSPSYAQTNKVLGAEARDAVAQFYEYDRNILLDVNVYPHGEDSTHVREKVVFTSVRNERVPGILAVPREEGPYACVLLLHGADGSKDYWFREPSIAHMLLESGFAVLALDAQYHGERLAANDYRSLLGELFSHQRVHKNRAALVQSVVDYRRGIDFLSSRADIDSTRIGVYGYSMGGNMAIRLAGVDSRVRATVACVAAVGASGPLAAIPSIANPVNYAPRIIADQAVLLLMGRTDPLYSVEEARQLHQLIGSEQKDIVIYDSGHSLPAEHVDRAVSWLTGHL